MNIYPSFSETCILSTGLKEPKALNVVGWMPEGGAKSPPAYREQVMVLILTSLSPVLRRLALPALRDPY